MIRPEMKKHYGYTWKKISKLIIERVAHCVNCGKQNGKGTVLTVHHIDFNPTNNNHSNLIVLCARCHLRKHGLIRKYGRDTDCQMLFFNK